MKKNQKEIIQQVVGAILWGLFLILAPFEVLLPGSIIWIPLLVWRESNRSKKYGFNPGFLIRFATIILIIVIAILLPTKYPDRLQVRVGKPGEMTLEDLHKRVENGALLFFPESHAKEKIIIKEHTMSLRKLIKQIEKQTGLTSRIGYCGNGFTILFGGDSLFGVTFKE